MAAAVCFRLLKAPAPAAGTRYACRAFETGSFPNDMTQIASSTLQARRQQMFPVLAADEITRVRRFASVQRFADGECVYETGKPSPGLLVILSGTLRVTGRDGHGNDVLLADHGPGSFSGEVGQLSGRRSFVDGTAVGPLEALLMNPEQLRALLVAEAALGENIMRALILRRVGLLETGAGGPVVIGAASVPGVARLRSFLSRNGIPHLWLDPADDEHARGFIERYTPGPEELPLVVCPDGSTLLNPTEEMLARCIGMLDADAADRVYDVAIAGAGPAGLAAAVYAASEGLSVLVVDSRAFGGQAGASARIENYLGFPTGISGQALAGRAYTQAQKFGATMLIPAEAVGLDCGRSHGEEPLALRVADGRTVRSRSVVIATGARYRRPVCSNLKALEGCGVWYWASPIEARMCAGQEVVLVGGGNSAGQAAVFLAGHASKVWMLVRGPDLAASMSQYLIDRIAATPNIELRTRTELVGITGARPSGIEAVRWRHRDAGHEETRAISHVFLFLGADPCTEWLRDCEVAVDDKGFVKTGPDSLPSHARTATRLPLETSVRGVFAIGDVHAGSVKRVGGAIGEGAAVVAQLHAFLTAPQAVAQ
jgi:thioredoxin reductase (NADPH)